MPAAVTVPGSAATSAPPAASFTTTIDGYTIALDGTPMARMTMPLKVSLSKDGALVTNLEPYLATCAHLSAFMLETSRSRTCIRRAGRPPPTPAGRS